MDAAVDQLTLAAHGKEDLAPHLNAPLFERLRDHPRWPALVAGAPPPLEPARTLHLAATAVARGDLDDAVPWLLAHWRDSRSPRVAALLDVLAAATGRRVGFRAGWLARALRDEPEWVFRRIDDAERVARDDACTVWLVCDADDPRAATALLDVLEVAPPRLARKHVEDGWQAALDQLVALGDVRAVPRLARAAIEAPARVPAPLRDWFAAALAAAAQAFAAQAPAPLCADDEASCLAMEAALRQPPATSAPAPLVPVRNHAAAAAPPEPTAALARAERAVAAESFNEATVQLLAAWEPTRAPRVADLLDRVDERRAAGGQASLAQGDWLAMAFAGRPDDLPRLLAQLRDASPQASAERLWALRGRADPRITTGLVGLLERPTFIEAIEPDSGISEYWEVLIEGFVRLRDVRAIEPLDAFAARVRTLAVHADVEARLNMYTHSPIGRWLELRVRKAADALRVAAPAPLDLGGVPSSR